MCTDLLSSPWSASVYPMGTTPPLLSDSFWKTYPHCTRILLLKGGGVCHRRGFRLRACGLTATASKKLCSLPFAQNHTCVSLSRWPFTSPSSSSPHDSLTRTVQNATSAPRMFLPVAPGTQGQGDATLPRACSPRENAGQRGPEFSSLPHSHAAHPPLGNSTRREKFNTEKC